MKTVGIFRGSGFIGSYTTKQFLEQGFKTKVSAKDVSTILKNVKPKGSARVIYKNEAAKRNLDLEFNLALAPLKAFSS
ncbi:hypothetical protein [uncultured Winogradskyella sp.]|uniref:hypothetical protein n=1 Tax=uncultured Winogradskyella sp. TaxID=395353 RepID=UPI0030DB2D2D|tara:strand:- start:6658 stop:6891 length:234 start_codon:yes stop_codon:yes gene_type:complete